MVYHTPLAVPIIGYSFLLHHWENYFSGLQLLRLGEEEERETVYVLERPKGQYIEYIGDTPQTLE